MRTEKKLYFIGTLGVVIISFLSVFWMVSNRNYFVFDDTSLLRDASLKSYSELFSFYPSSVYLDRPIRDVLLKWMFQLFGENHIAHHIVLVVFHLLNTVLVIDICKTVFEGIYNDQKKAYTGSLTAGLFFGAWPKTHMAVQWNSANNDLMGTTFALLCLLFFLRSYVRYRGCNTLFSLLFYYLAIRTKEMFYPLPVVLVLCDLYRFTKKRDQKLLSYQTMALLATMVIFFTGIILGKIRDQSLTYSPDSPYYQSFNPVVMMTNFFRYLLLSLDLKNGGFTYEQVTLTGIIGIGILVIGLLYSLILVFWKEEFGFLFLYVAVPLSISPVLPLINQTHVLYMYYPSVFVAAVIAMLILSIPSIRIRYACVAVSMACIVSAWFASGINDAKNYWLAIGDMEKKTRESIRQIEKPVENTTIYVYVPDKDSYHPFSYGPGATFNLAYQDLTLNTVVLNENETKGETFEIPNLVLSWKDGKIKELSRNSMNHQPVFSITGIYPNPVIVDNRSSDPIGIGITLNRMDSQFEVLVDGEPQTVYYADDFISISLLPEEIVNKDSVDIVVIDSSKFSSEPVKLKIER